MKKSNIGYYWAIFFVLALASLSFFIALFSDDQVRAWFIRENGLVETLSAVGYLFCILCMGRAGGKLWLGKNWYFLVVFLAFFARELDFDKRFTPVGILKSKFMIAEDVALTTKVIVLIILLVILASVVLIIKRHGKRFLINIFTLRLTPLEWGAGLGIFMLVCSKTLDGLGRKLKSFNIELSDMGGKIALYLEEPMEMAAPYLFSIAIFYLKEEIRRERETASFPEGSPHNTAGQGD